MAPWAKVAINERVGEQEVLGLSWRFEALHLPFPPARRSMRVLSTIVIRHNFTWRHWRSMKSWIASCIFGRPGRGRREHVKLGRPCYLMSCELALLSGRPATNLVAP